MGKPSKGLELKFDEDGEILVKGWARSEGYWNNPEATAELFADGWLHTGDIGYLDDDGFLNISGRKKELIITSSGKNISPANIQVLLEDKSLHFPNGCFRGREDLSDGPCDPRRGDDY